MENITMESLLFYCVFILSGSLHEAAHAWSAWRLGDGTAKYAGRMTLNPLAHIDLVGTVLFPLLNMLSGTGFLIGWMKPVPVHYGNLINPRKHSLLISLAGPFSNLLLAFAGSVAVWIFFKTGLLEAAPDTMITLGRLLINLVLINLILAAFNLLPIPPLDGSSIVDYIRKDHFGTYHSMGGIGIVILYAAFFLGLFRHLWWGALESMNFLAMNPLVSLALLGVFTGILVLFARRTSPGGAPRNHHRGPMDRSQEETRKEILLRKVLEKARGTAAAMARDEEVLPLEQRLYEKLKEDRGDGQALCSPISFDVRNEFCQACANLNRCIVRDAEEGVRPSDPDST